MKFLDKMGLAIFADLILILSVIVCLLVFGWLQVDNVSYVLRMALNNPTISNIMLVVSIAFILLAIKCVFFTSEDTKVNGIKDGILLKNEDGELVISKSTIEELINNVARGFDSAQNVVSKIVLDEEKNLKVYVTLSVTENAVIKELTSNLQTKIKSAVKKTADLEVKEVNISVRNLQVEETSKIAE